MRCIRCGAKMQLVKIIRTNIMQAPGYEHRLFTCSACPAVEQRLAFTPKNCSHAEPARTRATAMTSVATPSDEKLAGLRAWGRVMAKLRNRHTGTLKTF
jgi:hypothetical protein